MSVNVAISRWGVILVVSILALILLMAPFALFAQEQGNVNFIEPIPGITDGSDPEKIINSVFRLGVVVAAFLAVIMIVVGGFEYMTTEAVSGKSAAKDRIRSALLGLLLILISVVLLQIINPDILKIRLFDGLVPLSQRLPEISSPPPQGYTFLACDVFDRNNCHPLGPYETRSACDGARNALTSVGDGTQVYRSCTKLR